MWAGNLYQNSWWPWWAQTEAEALQRTRRHIEHVCTAGANGPRISCRFVVGCVRRVVHIHMKIQMSVVSVMERLWVTVGPAKIEKFHSEFETVSKSFSLSGHQRLGFGLFGFGYASLGLKSVGCNWTQTQNLTWYQLPAKKKTSDEAKPAGCIRHYCANGNGREVQQKFVFGISIWFPHFPSLCFKALGGCSSSSISNQLSAAYARRDCTKLLSSVLPDSWVFKWDSSCEAPANKQNPMRFSVAPFFHTSAASKQQPAEYPALSQSFLEGQQEKLVPASSLVLGS